MRVVLKEFPIFGKPSEEVSKIAIAANKQGRYFELHRALLDAPGRATKEQAFKLAEKLGLDVERLKRDMELPEVKKVIEETAVLADKMGLQGTPFYLVGDRSIPRARPKTSMTCSSKTSRRSGKNGCTATC